MTPAQHVAFHPPAPFGTRSTISWSRLEIPTFPDFPEVQVVSERRDDNKPIGMEARRKGWPYPDRRGQGVAERGIVHPMHFHAYRPPPDGDTLYADTYAAFRSSCPTMCGTRSWVAARASSARARFHEIYYPHLPPVDPREQKKARPDVWHSDRPPAIRIPGWNIAPISGGWGYKIDGMPDDAAQGADRLPRRISRRGRNSSTATSGASAMRCCGTTVCTQHCATRRSTMREVSAPHAAHDARRRSPIMAEARSLSPGSGSRSDSFQDRAGSTRQLSNDAASHTPVPASKGTGLPSFGISTRPRSPPLEIEVEFAASRRR
jgi:hypothetical protein